MISYSYSSTLDHRAPGRDYRTRVFEVIALKLALRKLYRFQEVSGCTSISKLIPLLIFLGLPQLLNTFMKASCVILVVWSFCIQGLCYIRLAYNNFISLIFKTTTFFASRCTAPLETHLYKPWRASICRRFSDIVLIGLPLWCVELYQVSILRLLN